MDFRKAEEISAARWRKHRGSEVAGDSQDCQGSLLWALVCVRIAGVASKMFEALVQ